MKTRLNMIVALGFGVGALSLSQLPLIAPANAADASVLSAVGTDHDGTIDLKEAQAAAVARFKVLDPDNDGTIDKKEAAAAGITDAEFAKADPDKDGTIDLKEYQSLVALRFSAAETDSDKTVDAAELATPAGQALAKLIK
jgi:Ca2+-binding EF-hand superfamily protein